MREVREMEGKTGFIIAATCVLLLSVAAESAGRMMGGMGGGGWGMGGAYGRMYDSAAVETISGEVVEVGQVIPVMGMSPGVHLTIRGVAGDMISVHLGPAWFIENQDVIIAPGDMIEVKGSRVMFDGQPALIAREVSRGDDILRLRDGNGYPVWSGWRRR
ncbi:MAG: hypothetical protein RQ753_09920 [Desulfurivibrionaceae bacterium]|nr:hypothetical protein [Desulfurivibrionaceae bacterium]